VVASSWPVAYLAQRVLGDQATVQSPIPEGTDPIHWVPNRAALASMQTASLIVLNGAGFEPWAERVTLPLSRVLHTARVFERDWIEHEQLEHSHGPGGDHSHSGVDPHTWLDPLLAKAQAGAVRDAWIDHNPEAQAVIELNFDGLAADLDTLHAEWRALTTSLNGRAMLASHPAYDYLAKRHGWTLINFDLDPEAVPTVEQLGALRQATTDHSPAAMLWESEPTPAVAAAVQSATGLSSIVVSPAEVRSDTQRTANTTYLDVQRANIARLQEALK
jgi:zinc transport system substrate-binding protein